jgi:hypothetical protein
MVTTLRLRMSLPVADAVHPANDDFRVLGSHVVSLDVLDIERALADKELVFQKKSESPGEVLSLEPAACVSRYQQFGIRRSVCVACGAVEETFCHVNLNRVRMVTWTPQSVIYK